TRDTHTILIGENHSIECIELNGDYWMTTDSRLHTRPPGTCSTARKRCRLAYRAVRCNWVAARAHAGIAGAGRVTPIAGGAHYPFLVAPPSRCVQRAKEVRRESLGAPCPTAGR